MDLAGDLAGTLSLFHCCQYRIWDFQPVKRDWLWANGFGLYVRQIFKIMYFCPALIAAFIAIQSNKLNTNSKQKTSNSEASTKLILCYFQNFKQFKNWCVEAIIRWPARQTINAPKQESVSWYILHTFHIGFICQCISTPIFFHCLEYAWSQAK